ncbi:MAG: tRNA (adenosine(37)-N6)-dimethylallyltransferase MiaA [Candidatus Saccharimonadales bacterium]
MASDHLTQPPLIVIAGPTASGKTGLSIELAKKYNGEIVCADSRTIYRGMDIGTAKPTLQERQGVVHWGLDLVEPGEQFSAADFKAYADEKIADIRRRGRVPFLVGGTGLYIDAVIFNYQFGNLADPVLRAQLEQLSVEQLQQHCINNNVELPENKQNKRYLIRAIEQKSINHKRSTAVDDNTIVVAIATDRDVLRTRIEQRTEQFFDNGVVEEATMLGKKYGWENEAMTGNIYPLVNRYLKSELSLEEMKEKFTTLDWRLAKRQITWLRRNSEVKWLSLTDAENYLHTVLAKTM